MELTPPTVKVGGKRLLLCFSCGKQTAGDACELIVRWYVGGFFLTTHIYDKENYNLHHLGSIFYNYCFRYGIVSDDYCENSVAL